MTSPLGVSGAAAASAASQWVGAIWCGLVIAKRLGVTTRIRIADVRNVMGVGFDLFVRTGLLTAFLLLATRAATRIGSDAGAAHQVIRQVWTFATFFLDATAITAQSLVGYFAGASRMTEARRVAGFVCRWGAGAGAFLGCVMILGHRAVTDWLVPPSAEAVFTPAWMVAAVLQPISALSFVTDGIHWGAGDYAFLRNAVILATLCGAAGLLLPVQGLSGGLTWIWAVTGGWVAIRAILGVIRIWPGVGRAPLPHDRWVSVRGSEGPGRFFR